MSRKSKADINNETGRDARQHIQVIAGKAGWGGYDVDFYHNNGEITKISPEQGRNLLEYLETLKPLSKQKAIDDIHETPLGLIKSLGV